MDELPFNYIDAWSSATLPKGLEDILTGTKMPLTEARGESRNAAKRLLQVLEDEAQAELHLAWCTDRVHAGAGSYACRFVVSSTNAGAIDRSCKRSQIAIHQVACAVEVGEIERVVEADVRMQR